MLPTKMGPPEPSKVPQRVFTLHEDASGVYSVRVSPDAKLVAAGCGDGTIVVKDLLEPSKSRFLSSTTGEQMPIMAMRFSGPYHLTTGSTNGYIQHWDMTTGMLVSEQKESDNNEIFTLDYTPDQSKFATAGKDKAIRLYDSLRGDVLRKFDEKLSDSDPERIYCLKFHPQDQNICIAGGWGRVINFWDVRVPRSIRLIQGPQICGEGIDVNETSIVTASWTSKGSSCLLMWDYRFAAREPVPYTLESADGAYLYCARFNPKNTTFAIGGSGTHDVRIFDSADRSQKMRLLYTDPVTNAPKAVQALDIAPTGKFMAYGGSASTIVVADLC